MKTLASFTVRMTTEKKDKLARLSRQQGLSMNRLIDEMVTVVLAENDSYRRFLIRAEQGNPEMGLRFLDKLDSLEEGGAGKSKK
ncbi:MAG: hypothetical protein ACYCTV_11555 [Leptospirales bacterium]